MTLPTATPPPGYTTTAPTRPSRRPAITAAAVTCAVIFTAIVGGIAGWTVRGNTTNTTANQPATATADPTPSAFTPDQARQRACDSYAAIGPEWGAAHRDFLPAVTRPGWSWTDPDVSDATKRFRVASNDVAGRITALIPPNTPADVSDPINAYTGAILTYGTDLGWQAQDVLNAHARAIDAAVTAADKACGLPSG